MGSLNSSEFRLLILLVLVGMIGINIFFQSRRNREYQDHLKKMRDFTGDTEGRQDTSLELQKEMVAKLGEIKSLLENRKA